MKDMEQMIPTPDTPSLIPIFLFRDSNAKSVELKHIRVQALMYHKNYFFDN